MIEIEMEAGESHDPDKFREQTIGRFEVFICIQYNADDKPLQGAE
jgi:hypothetical protein